MGVLVLAYSIFFELQVAAFVGLGLVFWGAVFALARNDKYVEKRLLDSTVKSAYSTYDRMIKDLRFEGQGYYIPPYPQGASLPEYLSNLREPVVFISEDFDGKPSADELAEGRFLSKKTRGVFITCPGSDLMSQIEKQVNVDFSKIDFNELMDILPRCITETFNLARSAEVSLVENGVSFDASGLLYQSLYRADPPLKSIGILGCPVVSAVASILAKASGKTVVVKKQVLSAGGSRVHVEFKFI
jgi:hypothetical protein